jgi:hypothetical protein
MQIDTDRGHASIEKAHCARLYRRASSFMAERFMT